MLLADGITAPGAASMGTLRAAELPIRDASAPAPPTAPSVTAAWSGTTTSLFSTPPTAPSSRRN